MTGRVGAAGCAGAEGAAFASSSCAWFRGGWAYAAVLAAAVLAHFSSLSNGFVWDDMSYILRNPVLRDAGNIPTLFTKPETWGTGGVNPYYRPLTTLTFLLDTLTWGGRPAGFHATNLLLHLGVCSLLLATLRRLLEPAAALAAALLFAVHPAHAEPVAFVSARADLVCAFFLLAAFLAWMRHGETRGTGALALAALAYGAALFAKVTAGPYLAVFVIYGLLFFPRRPRIRDLVPFAAAAFGFLVIRNMVLTITSWSDQPLLTHVATAGPILVRYALMALSPLHLSVFHGVPLRSELDAPAVVAWVAVGAAAAIAAARARRAPRAALGLAWFLAGLLPASNLIAVIYPALAADRYLYIPLIGGVLAVGAGLQRLSALNVPRLPRRCAVAAGSFALLALAGFTMARDRLWRDDVTLWERGALENPSHPFVLGALAHAYMETQRDEEALQVLLHALEVDDDNAEIHLDLVILGFRNGNYEAAERHLFRALEIAPHNPRAYRCLGGLLHQNQDVAVARRVADRAIELGILDVGSLQSLGVRLVTPPAAEN